MRQFKRKQCQFCKNFFHPDGPKRHYCSLECSFWDRVEFGHPSECWPWPYYKVLSGYGQLRFSGKSFQAHRIIWEELHGKIPDGMCILHTCDNPPCVNPAHLFLGTKLDNTKDMISKGRKGNNKGEKNGPAKLTNNDVINIRQLISKGILQKFIAIVYNVDRTTISAINVGKSWSHI